MTTEHDQTDIDTVEPEFDEDLEEDLLAEEDEYVDDVVGDDLDTDEDEAEAEEEADEALDELEAEELELLDEEIADTLPVDEVEELRAIRREELTLDVDAQSPREGEFVCQSCFLVKRVSQLANRRKMICTDCAS